MFSSRLAITLKEVALNISHQCVLMGYYKSGPSYPPRTMRVVPDLQNLLE